MSGDVLRWPAALPYIPAISNAGRMSVDRSDYVLGLFQGYNSPTATEVA